MAVTLTSLHRVTIYIVGRPFEVKRLCAAAYKCAARAVEVCRGRMSEIKSLQ